jgi:hypothetical protein
VILEKKRIRTVRKRRSLADRKRCQVNRPVKRPVIYLYLYCKLISVYEKYRVSVKSLFFYQFTTVYGPFMLTWGEMMMSFLLIKDLNNDIKVQYLIQMIQDNQILLNFQFLFFISYWT